MNSRSLEIEDVLSRQLRIEGKAFNWNVVGPKIISDASEIYRATSSGFTSPIAIKRMDLAELTVQFSALQHARDLLSSADGFSAPRPIAMIEAGNDGLLIMEWVDAPSAETLLTRRAVGSPDLYEAVVRSGKLLALLHKNQRTRPDALDPTGFIEDVNQAFAGHRKPDKLVTEAMEHLAQAPGQIFSLDLPVTRLHGDFKPANILVSGENTYCIDAAFTGEGATIHELAHYTNHLLLALYHPRVLPRLRESEKLVSKFLNSWETLRGPIAKDPLNWLRLQKLLMTYASISNREAGNLKKKYLHFCLKREIRRLLYGKT